MSASALSPMRTRDTRVSIGSPLLFAFLLGVAAPAGAHTGGRAFILLLPGDLYMAAGAVVVALSFLLISLIPSTNFARVERLRRRLAVVGGLGARGRLASCCPSLVSFFMLLLLIVAGRWGSRDPLSNPLPLFVWTVWWIGFTYLHLLFGNVWAYLNPRSGLYRVATSLPGVKQWIGKPPLRYPRWVAYWPAVFTYLVFVWIELIHPSPADPAVLANMVSLYLAVNFLGIFLFGERPWLQYAEAFSVFFRVISWLSPLAVRNQGDLREHCELEHCPPPNSLNCSQYLGGESPKVVDITLPGLNLLSVRPLALSGVAFVLLVLSSVSFDGLSKTFFWLGLIGENPLEYPGRTALMIVNTAGLLGVFAALTVVFMAVLSVAKVLSGIGNAIAGQIFGVFVLSIVPIAFGYHFAHYLPVFLVDIQYAVRAMSDPLARGWDVFGTADLPIITSFLSDRFRVIFIWYAQMMIIVSAHVAGIYVAHALALRLAPRARTAIIGQVPLTLLMVGYTLFGLWLLSAPAVG